MTALTWVFWLSAAWVTYTFVGYPIFLWAFARLRPRPHRRSPGEGPRSVSIVVAAHNEEAAVGRRLTELSERVAASGVAGEIVLVSDGSTDRTVEIARSRSGGDVPIRVIELERNVGKAAALTVGCLSARKEILVLADARQTWAPDALGRLLENFADPRVGGVSGDLVLEAAPGVTAGVGLYWRYEKWIRGLESLAASVPGVSGSISAVRRELFTPIPAGTILDDVFWPMHVIMRGFRVVHDDTAKAFDRLPAKSRDEFRRKVRTLSGNFQLAARVPAILLPWRNPIWLQFVSHKLMRLGAPWALLAMFVATLPRDGTFWRLMLAAQLLFYVVGGVAAAAGEKFRPRPLAAIGSFLLLNAAAGTALWVWITGGAARSWTKVAYDERIPTPANAPPAPIVE